MPFRMEGLRINSISSTTLHYTTLPGMSSPKPFFVRTSFLSSNEVSSFKKGGGGWFSTPGGGNNGPGKG